MINESNQVTCFKYASLPAIECMSDHLMTTIVNGQLWTFGSG